VTFLAAFGALVATFFAAAAFFAATGAAVFVVATGAVFFAVALFFTTFAAFPVFAEDLPAAVLPAPPPKMESQLDAYFSLVPTRVIVTKSPFKNVHHVDSICEHQPIST
jgi:hypothetical protein